MNPFRLLPAIVAFLACCAAVAGSRADESQWRGSKGSAFSPMPEFSVVRSAEGWIRLWQAFDQPAPPDFRDGRDMAVSVTLGIRPTTGYAINIVGAEKRGLFLVIHWQERSPSPNAYVAQVVTSPWLIERLDRSDLFVVFRKDDEAVFAWPRLEYFAFKAAFPRCAALIDGTLPPMARLYVLDADILAPFFGETPACAKG